MCTNAPHQRAWRSSCDLCRLPGADSQGSKGEAGERQGSNQTAVRPGASASGKNREKRTALHDGATTAWKSAAARLSGSVSNGQPIRETV